MPINRQFVKEAVATYASVLLDGAQAAGGQDAVLEVRDQLETVVKTTRTSVDLNDALADPSFTPEQRNDLVHKVFGELKFNPVLIEVLAVMAERGDFRLLSRVWTSYGEQLESKLDITVVDVVTAVPLDEGLRKTIINKAESDLDSGVVLRERVDKSILGGIIMSAGGRRIDASVFSQLETARNVLKQSTDGGEC